MSNIDSARMHAWLDLHDPKLTRTLHSVSDDLISVLRAHALAAGQSLPVVSAATVAGSAASSVIAKSLGLQKTPTLDTFLNSPMDGCTSLMDMARVAAGFDPSNPDTHANQAAYRVYITKLLQCPLFSCNYSDTQTTSRKGKNWNELIDAIADMFEGVAAQDKSKITDSLKNLAKAAATRSSTLQTEDLFVQNVLYAESTSYLVYIYNSHVSLQQDQKKGSTSFQDTFTITRTQLRFRQDEWSFWAKAVWAKHYRTVMDWLEDNNTMAGDRPAKLCIAPIASGAATG